jgi:hypothetical protein
MTTKLLLTRDKAGLNAYGRVQSDFIHGGPLSAGVADTFTAPTDASEYLVIFSYTVGSSIWVRIGGAATLPASLGTLSVERNPAVLQVSKGQTVSVITSDAGIVYSASFYDASEVN